MPYSLILDVIVAGLLVIMIPYIIRLNKRLGMLRKDKAQLEKLAATFAESTRRADESLGNLRASAENMQRKLDTAQTLHDDLVFLLDRGEKTADRLEDMVRVSRSEMSDASAKTAAASPPARKPMVASPQLETDKNSPGSEAERELLKAIRSAN